MKFCSHAEIVSPESIRPRPKSGCPKTIQRSEMTIFSNRSQTQRLPKTKDGKVFFCAKLIVCSFHMTEREREREGEKEKEREREREREREITLNKIDIVK